MSGADLPYWIGFNKVPGIGAARLQALLEAFGDLDTAWRAPADALRHAGLDRRSLANLLRVRSELDLDAEVARLESAGVQAITWDDPDYTPNLRKIY